MPASANGLVSYFVVITLCKMSLPVIELSRAADDDVYLINLHRVSRKLHVDPGAVTLLPPPPPPPSFGARVYLGRILVPLLILTGLYPSAESNEIDSDVEARVSIEVEPPPPPPPPRGRLLRRGGAVLTPRS